MAQKDISAIQIVIASRLGDGRVVYLGPTGWTERLAEAEQAASQDAAAALLARAQESFARNEVIDAYLTELVADARGIRLKHLREHIRSQGPTIRPDLGYQAAEVS